VPTGPAEMVAATIRTIFAQPGPAQVREQLGVIAGMLGRQFPGSRRCCTAGAHDITASHHPVAGAWATHNPLITLPTGSTTPDWLFCAS